jgi:D-alanyl-D-alanine carboxypeptidase
MLRQYKPGVNIFPQEKIQSILNHAVDGKVVHGAVVSVESNSVSWCGAAGNLEPDCQYFIASTTKLFITAILLQFREERRLALDDRLSKHLPEENLKGLHVLKGIDRSRELTIRNLMAHTSGLPDYFQQKKPDGTSLQKDLMSGRDRAWNFEWVMGENRKLAPLFEPGQRGKAHYSDTNYQVLGRIIEAITGQDLAAVIAGRIADRLGLAKTYLYRDRKDMRPRTLYYGPKELPIPMAMASFGPDGGVVSTAREMMMFLRAFFNGKLFPGEYLEGLKSWNRIFFPMQSGIGIHRFKLPWFFSPVKSIPELIGHSGLSGAFAFYCPEKEVYLTGTVNQVSRPETSFKLMIRLLNAL